MPQGKKSNGKALERQSSRLTQLCQRKMLRNRGVYQKTPATD